VNETTNKKNLKKNKNLTNDSNSKNDEKKLKSANIKRFEPELLGTRVWRINKDNKIYSVVQHTDSSTNPQTVTSVKGTFRWEPKGGKTVESITKRNYGVVSSQDSKNYGKYYTVLTYRDNPSISVYGSFEWVDEERFKKLIKNVDK